MAAAVSKIVKDGTHILDTTGVMWVRRFDGGGKWYLGVCGTNHAQLEFTTATTRDDFFNKIAIAMGA